MLSLILFCYFCVSSDLFNVLSSLLIEVTCGGAMNYDLGVTELFVTLAGYNPVFLGIFTLSAFSWK